MDGIYSGYGDDLLAWGDDEERTAGYATAVDVDPVVSLLFPEELEGFMPALAQSGTDDARPIYAFVDGGAISCP